MTTLPNQRDFSIFGKLKKFAEENETPDPEASAWGARPEIKLSLGEVKRIISLLQSFAETHRLRDDKVL